MCHVHFAVTTTHCTQIIHKHSKSGARLHTGVYGTWLRPCHSTTASRINCMFTCKQIGIMPTDNCTENRDRASAPNMNCKQPQRRRHLSLKSTPGIDAMHTWPRWALVCLASLLCMNIWPIMPVKQHKVRQSDLVHTLPILPNQNCSSSNTRAHN